MDEKLEQPDVSRKPAGLHLFWIVITVLFAVFFVMSLCEWTNGTERIDRVLAPAVMFLLGIINIFSPKGALRNILIAACVFLMISALTVMLLR